MQNQSTAPASTAERLAFAAGSTLTLLGREIGLGQVDDPRAILRDLTTVTYRLKEILLAVDHALPGESAGGALLEAAALVADAEVQVRAARAHLEGNPGDV